MDKLNNESQSICQACKSFEKRLEEQHKKEYKLQEKMIKIAFSFLIKIYREKKENIQPELQQIFTRILTKDPEKYDRNFSQEFYELQGRILNIALSLLKNHFENKGEYHG